MELDGEQNVGLKLEKFSSRQIGGHQHEMELNNEQIHGEDSVEKVLIKKNEVGATFKKVIDEKVD